MRKLLSLLAAFTMVGFMVSCDDDDDDAPVFDDPTVTGPGAQSVTVNETITLDFTVEIPGGFASSALSAQSGGTATIASDLSAGDTDGTISVEFVAGNTAGAGSFTLTVTDQQATPESVAVTAVINVSASAVPSIAGIPSNATIVEGQTLTVPDVVLTAEDGFAASNAFTVNGADLSALITGASPQTVTVEADAATLASLGADGPGSYDLVFELTDADGDVAEFTHVLTIEAVEFFAQVETIDDGGTEDDPSDDLIFIEVSGSINSDYELPAEGPDGQEISYYVLAGRVKVTNGATFTIPEGSVLKGREGTGSNATALLVARGSTLNAVGSASAPIIFTTINDNLTMADVAAGDLSSPNLADDLAGQWGGVIVLGNANISASNDSDEDLTEVQIEGIPASDPDGLYGGDNDSDDSGDIAYISIRHGGSNIGSGNEINGLTLGGVGSGTSITNVEVVANADDGIEWFGGTVDVDGALIWNSGDDSMDTDQAWNGTCSNFLIVTPIGGSAFELDGPEGTYENGNHTFTDGVVYAGMNIDHLIDFDPTTNADINNLYIFGITQGDVEEYTPSIQTVTNIEYTFDAALDEATVFGAIPASELTSVAENNNSVGFAASTDFSWTWADDSGALAGIGL